ncbi:hypothetical protein Ancab_006784 [Ancistrocladus abbreviatus]
MLGMFVWEGKDVSRVHEWKGLELVQTMFDFGTLYEIEYESGEPEKAKWLIEELLKENGICLFLPRDVKVCHFWHSGATIDTRLNDYLCNLFAAETRDNFPNQVFPSTRDIRCMIAARTVKQLLHLSPIGNVLYNFVLIATTQL